MESVLFSDVLELPVEQRIRLAQAIWDSVAEQPGSVKLTDAHRAGLDRCLTEYLEDPNEGSPWPEVRARLLSGE
jgi:putative addiction module component (TIGR02574 family)